MNYQLYLILINIYLLSPFISLRRSFLLPIALSRFIPLSLSLSFLWWYQFSKIIILFFKAQTGHHARRPCRINDLSHCSPYTIKICFQVLQETKFDKKNWYFSFNLKSFTFTMFSFVIYNQNIPIFFWSVVNVSRMYCRPKLLICLFYQIK